jgi:hypothetical protein
LVAGAIKFIKVNGSPVSASTYSAATSSQSLNSLGNSSALILIVTNWYRDLYTTKQSYSRSYVLIEYARIMFNNLIGLFLISDSKFDVFEILVCIALEHCFQIIA